MIIDRKLVELNEIQKKILNSGWKMSTGISPIVEKITYLSDGLRVKGYLAYPENTNKRYPCIIWCRGGFGNKGSLDDFYAQGILGQLASWGYVVFETQYRGNDGGEGKDEFGGRDLNDVLNLIPLADDIEFADKDNWGIEGWSRGGMMTYLILTRSNIFKAAITSGGITNLKCNADESPFMKKLFGGIAGKLSDDFCDKRMILKFIDNYSKTTPTLLIHGTHDDRVPPHHSLDLSYKFLEKNINHRLVLLENGDHFLRDHKQEVDALRKNWFEKYLK